MDDLLQRVKDRIERHGLQRKEAAKQIGVTPTSLERHLEGAYVRSDSLAKYRSWLNASTVKVRPTPSLPVPPPTPPEPLLSRIAFAIPPFTRRQPYNVIDLFSGSGGMSLGFDLLTADACAEKSEHAHPTSRPSPPIFQTVLALDLEDKVVSLHNDNHRAGSGLQGPPARWVNIADFLNPAEMLAFYLDHLALRSGDRTLAGELDRLPQLGCAAFKDHVRQLDAHFLAALVDIRSSAAFRRQYAALDSTIAGQTSVIGFHRALALPETATNCPLRGPLVWADHDVPPPAAPKPPALPPLKQFAKMRATTRLQLSQLWEAETSKLRTRTTGTGAGQLASSAGRISRFLTFLHTPPMQEVQDAWLSWRSTRDALRQVIFGHDAMEPALRRLYTGQRRVDVLLGGPPCQGFSRIGRGKLRSLREHQVHVETDPEAGDLRNLLLLKYVEFVSALEPRLFLFENVRHFQARVQTPEGTFLATEILKEAIEELSQRRLRYRVVDRIVDCSRHAIPQTRERFVMVGVRSDLSVPDVDPEDLPNTCLDLPIVPPIPLRVALAGLPAPTLARSQGPGEEIGLARKVPVADGLVTDSASSAMYWDWVRHELPRAAGRLCHEVDAHTIRPPRPDDEAFFRLLGPGERWMDYRCDDSSTLRDLRRLIETLLAGLTNAKSDRKNEKMAGIDRITLEDLLSRLDGSLSLRLLLESIAPQEGELRHHLLTASYLAKKEGNNGDWIARLHPDRPAKTIVSHMAKDTYAYVHPSEPRTLSVREAARIQTFPDWFCFGGLGLVDAFRAVGNAVPPLLSYQFARQVARLLWASEVAS